MGDSIIGDTFCISVFEKKKGCHTETLFKNYLENTLKLIYSVLYKYRYFIIFSIL